MRCPSQPTKGAVVRRHERGLGFAVDASGVVADACGRAGQWIEPSPVSRCKPRERTAFDPAKPHGEAELLAYGETVWSWPSSLRSSLCEGVTRVNRRGGVNFATATETKGIRLRGERA